MKTSHSSAHEHYNGKYEEFVLDLHYYQINYFLLTKTSSRVANVQVFWYYFIQNAEVISFFSLNWQTKIWITY